MITVLCRNSLYPVMPYCEAACSPLSAQILWNTALLITHFPRQNLLNGWFTDFWWIKLEMFLLTSKNNPKINFEYFCYNSISTWNSTQKKGQVSIQSVYFDVTSFSDFLPNLINDKPFIIKISVLMPSHSCHWNWQLSTLSEFS